MCMAFTREQSAFPSGWQSTLRKAQGVGNAGIGLIGLIGPIGLMALGCVCAMLSGIFKAHGSHASCAPVRTSPYKSVQVRIPLPAPCALHKVLCQPTAPLLRPSLLRYAAVSQVLHKFSDFFSKKSFPLLTLTVNLAIINMCPYLIMFA